MTVAVYTIKIDCTFEVSKEVSTKAINDQLRFFLIRHGCKRGEEEKLTAYIETTCGGRSLQGIVPPTRIVFHKNGFTASVIKVASP